MHRMLENETTHRRARARFGRVARMSAAAALLVLGVGVISPAQADTVSDEAVFVKEINKARTDAGLKPLAVHNALINAGRSWAEKMKAASLAAGAVDENGFPKCLISHNPNLRNAVDAPWLKLGENVGCGDVTPELLHQAFMESPKHRANILDPDFDSIGIGIVEVDGVIFVTEQFMKLDSQVTDGAIPAALAIKTKKPTANVQGAALSRVSPANAKAAVTKKVVTKKVTNTVAPAKVRTTK